MSYCIVEGRTDCIILTKVFDAVKTDVKIIVSNGFPSMPAVARTIMSYMEENDKVMIVCDQDNFQEGSYGKDMLGFLLRGAMNNPSFKLFTFNPNIDYLVANPQEGRGWKVDATEVEKRVCENMESILNDNTVRLIVEFAKQ